MLGTGETDEILNQLIAEQKQEERDLYLSHEKKPIHAQASPQGPCGAWGKSQWAQWWRKQHTEE